MDLWVQLTLEGKFDLINKLGRVECKEPGFGTIIVPPEGFSENDDTHNKVLDWLEARGVNVLNVGWESRKPEMDSARVLEFFLDLFRSLFFRQFLAL